MAFQDTTVNGSYDMTVDFDDLPFDDYFGIFNYSNYTENYNYYGNYRSYDSMTNNNEQEIHSLVADYIRYGEYILTLCGLVLSAGFISILIAAMRSSRNNKTVMSRMWLTFGMLSANALFLACFLFHDLILMAAQRIPNRALCIFVASIYECLDFASTLTASILAYNLYLYFRIPHTMGTRKGTLLWVCAGFAAWVLGFGVGLAIGMSVTETTKDGHCYGQTSVPFISVIRFVVEFCLPYTCSFVLTWLSLINWNKVNRNVYQFELAESRGEGQEQENREVAETSSTGKLSGDRASDTIQVDEGVSKVVASSSKAETLPTDTVKGVDITSSTDHQDIRDSEKGCKQGDEERHQRRSSMRWVVFNAVNVYLGFLCRLVIMLPITHLMMRWEPYLLFWISAHTVFIFYLSCFPLLCLIPIEIRAVFRKFKVCYKVLCWCCECCI